MLLWGMNHIKEQGYGEIILHVAEWNQNAVKLYLKNGFSIKKRKGCVKGIGMFSIVLLNDIKDVVLAPCIFFTKEISSRLYLYSPHPI